MFLEGHMPERIDTAQMVGVDTETLEVNDAFPGAYGFYVRLSRDPGTAWEAEFSAAYESRPYPGKAPVIFRGDTLCVFFLPLYAGELPEYIRFLETVLDETNRAVMIRNESIPDDRSERDTLKAALRAVADELKRRG